MLALVVELEYDLKYPVQTKDNDGNDCRAAVILNIGITTITFATAINVTIIAATTTIAAT